jgi:hypothetical protein
MTLHTRPPTGKVAAPLILLEGGEKAGKSYSAAQFSTSDKVGRVLWLDLGEGAADEYAAIPGTRYEVIEHDGSYHSIYGQVCAARDEAHRAAAAGEPPVVLVIDNMTALWELLKEWIDGRARRRPKNRAALEKDPNTEIDLTTDLWNDATGRWRAVMTKLMTFNGPVIAIARGKEVVEIGPDGKPTRNRTYRVEGQKHLPYDATVWVRMTREDGAKVIGARSVHLGLRPGERAKALPDDWSLEWLIFDQLRYEPGVIRDLRETGSAVEQRADAEDLREQALTRGATRNDLLSLHSRADAAGLLTTEVMDGDGNPTSLGALIVARGQALKPVAAA